MRRRAIAAAIAGISSIGLLASLVSTGAAGAATPGSLDPTFGNSGKVLSNVGSRVIPSDALLQGNEDILVSLELEFGFAVARYLPNGALDGTFGKGGLAKATFSTVEGQIVNYDPTGAIALQSDGKILEAGDVHAANATADPFGVVRFNANGTLDSTFGQGGEVITDFFAQPLAGVHEGAHALLVEPDGKILVGGEARQGQSRTAPILGALARYNPNGTLDTTFGNGGKVTLASGAIRTLGLDSAGDIFVAPGASELSPTGQVDANVTPATITSSSVGGPQRFLANGQSIFARSIVVSSGGYSRVSKIQTRRFNPDGSLDSSFSSPLFKYTGTTTTQGSDEANAVAIAPNGQIVVVGGHFASTQVFGVARLNANGSLDSAFGAEGLLTTSFQEFATATAVLVQPDGRIVAVGRSSQNSTGEEGLALARYLG